MSGPPVGLLRVIDSLLEDAPALLAIEQAARIFSCSERTVRRWIQAGRLRVFRTSAAGAVKIPRTEIRALLVAMAERE